MNLKDKNIDKNIYDICFSIHNLAKLNVEFWDTDHKSSFQLFNSHISFIAKSSRSETTQYIYSFLKDKSSKDYLYHKDNFQLSYLGIGLWEDTNYRGVIIVGPFLSGVPDEAFISSIIEKNNLSLGQRLQLTQYYNSLKVLSLLEYSSLASLIVTLASNSFINANSLSSDNKDLTVSESVVHEQDNEKIYSKIELRYSLQKKLMHAVEKGLDEEALSILKSYPVGIYQGVSLNSLRSRKNIAFSFNATLRIAVERGGVSPIYIHNLYDKFSILIESLSTVDEIDNNQKKMISEYCELVRKFSSAGYSPPIRKAIDYINLNFSSEISLNIISEKINISPSHLSRQFKKETNLSITDFINKKRVEEAKFLIKQANHSITDIALMVGFQNHNYFCKVFKQITFLTPKEYFTNGDS